MVKTVELVLVFCPILYRVKPSLPGEDYAETFSGRRNEEESNELAVSASFQKCLGRAATHVASCAAPVDSAMSLKEELLSWLENMTGGRNIYIRRCSPVVFTTPIRQRFILFLLKRSAVVGW